VIWLDVLRADTPKGAERARGSFTDARVWQVHDGARASGRAVAPLVRMPDMRAVAKAQGMTLDELEAIYHSDFVRGPPCAFDMVLLYGPEASWKEGQAPPAPREWRTQLDPDTYPGLDPAHVRFGDEMAADLKRLLGELLAEEQGGER
jgi:hypothetical protein